MIITSKRRSHAYDFVLQCYWIEFKEYTIVMHDLIISYCYLQNDNINNKIISPKNNGFAMENNDDYKLN